MSAKKSSESLISTNAMLQTISKITSAQTNATSYDYLQWVHLHVPGKVGGLCERLQATDTAEKTHNSHFHELNKCNSDHETTSSLIWPSQHRSMWYLLNTATYRKCFARASLCNADHIIATKSQRPALSLDGCWFGPVLFVDYIHHIGWGKEQQLVKMHKTSFEMFIQIF